MSVSNVFAEVLTRFSIARLILVVAGSLAIVWAVAVIPVFLSEKVILDVASAVINGEAFKPEVLAAVDAQTETNAGSKLRSSVLGEATVIRLRQAEDAIRARDPKLINQKLASLTSIVQRTFANAPDDPFLWLVWFWLDSKRSGVGSGNLPFLRMSYDLGPYEGWIAVKRDYVAVADYSTLPSDLAERAISEFVGLVRWGLFPQAADIAAAAPAGLRRVLFARLNDLSFEERRNFANVIYARELDDVPVPGIALPPPPVSMPVLPPDFFSR